MKFLTMSLILAKTKLILTLRWVFPALAHLKRVSYEQTSSWLGFVKRDSRGFSLRYDNNTWKKACKYFLFSRFFQLSIVAIG
jgi:hypothetical protein